MAVEIDLELANAQAAIALAEMHLLGLRSWQRAMDVSVTVPAPQLADIDRYR